MDSNNHTHPGFELACPGEDGQPGTDGRTDAIHYSKEDVQEMVDQQERERNREREEVTAALSPERRSSPLVTFEATPVRERGAGTVRQEVIEVDDPVETLGTDCPPGVPTERTSSVIGNVPPKEPPAPTGHWYGLVRPSGQRVATNSSEQAMEWQYSGDKLERIFQSRREAETWVSDTRIVPRSPVAPTVIRGIAAPAPAAPNRVLPQDAFASPPRTLGPQDPMTHMLERMAHMPTGPDPSTGTQMIFGLDPTNEMEMDSMLLPPHMTDADQRKEFFNIAMDVTSLPGGYRSTDDDDNGGTEALMHVLGHGTSTFRAWRKISLNALAKIKSKDELLVFVRDVEKVVVRHRTAEHQR